MQAGLTPPTAGRRRFRLALIVFFWLGIALCAVALARYARQGSEVFAALSAGRLLLLLCLMAMAWLLAVQGWRAVVRSTGAGRLVLRDAARHLALLLIGKYMPGGIWGFAARLGDTVQSRPALPMFMAGLADQWLGVSSVFAVSAVLWLAVDRMDAWLLVLLLVVPLLAATFWRLAADWMIKFGHRIAPRLLAGVDPIRGSLHCGWLGVGATCVTGQVLMQMVAVGLLACWMLDLSTVDAAAVAAFYGLGIAAGMVAIFAPGGILVREGAFVALGASIVSPEHGVALAAALRLMFTGFDLMAGLLVLVLKKGG